MESIFSRSEGDRARTYDLGKFPLIKCWDFVEIDGPCASYFEAEGERFIYHSYACRSNTEISADDWAASVIWQLCIGIENPVIVWRERPVVALEGDGYHYYYMRLAVMDRESVPDFELDEKVEMVLGSLQDFKDSPERS